MATQNEKARTKPTVDEVAEAIKAAMPTLDATDQQIVSTIHRLMSSGDPVDPEAVANAVGGLVGRVNEKLDSWPGVYRDEQGRLVGFWGQAIEALDPEYRFIDNGKTSYAWCALDTLFIPPLIGRTIRIEASDPVTGQPVSAVVESDGVRDVQPAGAVVSMVVPEGPFGYDVIDSFCHRVLFFTSEVSGAKWIAEHEGTMLLSVDEAFELGRSMTKLIAPDIFDRAQTA